MAEKQPGAYIVTHEETDLFYVGSSERLTLRRYDHKTDHNAGKHKSKKLQEAFNASPNVTIEKIPTTDREQAFALEQQLLDKHRGNPRMVNIATDARLSGKGLVRSDDFKKRVSEALIGTTHSDETKVKMSVGKMGKCSDAQYEHLVAMNKARTGVPLADSTKALMSEQRKGVSKSEEHAKAIGDALRGKPKSAEHIAKVQEARKGFKHDDETKARIAAKVKATLAAKKAALKN